MSESSFPTWTSQVSASSESAEFNESVAMLAGHTRLYVAAEKGSVTSKRAAT